MIRLCKSEKPLNKFSPMREGRFCCKATYLSVSLRSNKDSKSEFAALVRKQE